MKCDSLKLSVLLRHFKHNYLIGRKKIQLVEFVENKIPRNLPRLLHKNSFFFLKYSIYSNFISLLYYTAAIALETRSFPNDLLQLFPRLFLFHLGKPAPNHPLFSHHPRRSRWISDDCSFMPKYDRFRISRGPHFSWEAIDAEGTWLRNPFGEQSPTEIDLREMEPYKRLRA